MLLGCTMAAVAGAMPLSDYVADVVIAHPDVRQRIHAYRQIEQDRQIALSGWRPTVDLTASAGQYSTESPITGGQRRDYDSSQAALTVTQNLFNGFDTSYQVEQNDARLASALYQLYDTADNIALDAAKAYLEALKQRRLVELAEQNVESHERILWQIRERNDSGAGRRSEVEQTEGRLARAHASLIAQQANLQEALTEVHKLLGRYLGSEELEVPAAVQLSETDLERLIDLALERHPAVQVARYNVEAAQSDYRRSRRTNYPRLDLQLQKRVGQDISGYVGDTDEHAVVLNLRYNLYNGGADAAEQRKRVSVVHENDAFAARVRRQVIETMRLAWIADASLNRQLEFLARHVDRARETVESYRKEFFIGQRDLIDLLDAESELNAAHINHAGAQFDELAARFRIYEGMGELFRALDLDVTVSESEFKFVSLQATGNDTLPLDPDRDRDGESDRQDHCDNTLPGQKVDTTGCAPQLVIVFGYARPPLKPIEPIHFLFDKTEMTAESKARFATIVQYLREAPPGTIEIRAYTDGRGSFEYNRRLSLRRAEAVRRLLIDSGIGSHRVKVLGMGQGAFADEATDEGRALNRRGELRVIGHEER